ncbi:MAG: type II secretion system GspH family protein [Elusimicrobiaceae bacterium]|nr:type II secretion system GspH family protein [Elusimicrobiaceae bacterium]
MKHNQAFTLIELLVVVLIIGILAAVALPQYQKSVEKSKAAQALTVLNAYSRAFQTYYMAEGATPTSLDVLTVDMPWSGTNRWTTGHANGAVSNEDWALELYSNSNQQRGICVGRLRGEYRGAGFCKFLVNPIEGSRLKTDVIYCAERNKTDGIQFQKEKGDYCRKIFGGTYLLASNFWFFSLP